MDKELLRKSHVALQSVSSEVNFEEYVKNLDELVNNKVA